MEDITSPIAGVDLETYVLVVKGISRLGHDTDRLVDVAAEHRVDAASWRLAQAGWSARIQGDHELGARFDDLYTRA